MLYDLFLPIGERCHTYAALREVISIEFGLFDALGCVTLPAVYEACKNNFSGFLLQENLIFSGKENGENWEFNDKSSHVRVRHIFRSNLPPEESLRHYYPVLLRLKARTMNKLKKSHNILFIHSPCEFSYSKEEYIDYGRKLRRLFPKKQCDFLFFHYNEFATDYKTVHNADGIRICELPHSPYIKTERKGEMEVFGNTPILKQALSSYLITSLINGKDEDIHIATLRYLAMFPHIWYNFYRSRILSHILIGKRAEYYKFQKRKFRKQKEIAESFLKANCNLFDDK